MILQWHQCCCSYLTFSTCRHFTRLILVSARPKVGTDQCPLLGTSRHFDALRKLGRCAGMADAPPPLQLQPRIFSHRISSIGAVARSPRKVAPSEGPCRPIAERPPSFRRSRANSHHISFDLAALSELLHNLLKHLGRIVLTTSRTRLTTTPTMLT